MANLYNLLQKIHQKPGVYIGSPSVSSLYLFLCGYGFSRQEQGLELTAEEQEFEQFQTWVQQRFKITTSVSWAKIILLHSADERAGFELFFKLLAEFVNEQRPQQEIKVQLAKVGFDLEGGDLIEKQQVLDKLSAHKDRLDEFAVKALFLFGSVARDEATSDSDVDFWVEFTRPVGLFTLLGLKAYSGFHNYAAQ